MTLPAFCRTGRRGNHSLPALLLVAGLLLPCCGLHAQPNGSRFIEIAADLPCDGPATAPHCAVKTFQACTTGHIAREICDHVGLPLTEDDASALRSAHSHAPPAEPWRQPFGYIFGEGYLFDEAYLRPVGYPRFADVRPPVQFATHDVTELHIDASDIDSVSVSYNWSYFLRQAEPGEWVVVAFARWEQGTEHVDPCERPPANDSPRCALYVKGLPMPSPPARPYSP